MINNALRIIAKRSRSIPANSNIGYIKPLFRKDDRSENFVKIDSSQEFPSDGEVFVTRGFNLIETDFAKDDLFEVTEVTESDTYDPARYGSCLYTCSAGSTQKLLPFEFVRIFDQQFNLEAKTVKGLPALSDNQPGKNGVI